MIETARPSLLVVDDEAEMAELVRDAAESVGYRASIATSAAEFWRAVGQGRPDVIVLDLVMPDSDGIELLQELAASDCDSAVVVISGYGGRYLAPAARLAEARGLKVADTLVKPVTLDQLEATLVRLRPGS